MRLGLSAHGILRCVPSGDRRRTWSITLDFFGVDRIDSVVCEAIRLNLPSFFRITRRVLVKYPGDAIVNKHRMTVAVLRVRANEKFVVQCFLPDRRTLLSSAWFGVPLRADRYRRRDRGLLLVPCLTIFLTHATVMPDRPAGSTQMTFEWYLPH